MKITDKNSKTIDFIDLPIGQVFRSIFSCAFYMKTTSVADHNGTVISNAVRLHDGFVEKFDDDHLTVIVNAELIIN
jgi:hypothetical protein